MSLITKLKAEITEALISGNSIKKDILKLLLSECQRENKYEDVYINKVASKLIQSNAETMKIGGLNQKLLTENTYLTPYVAHKATAYQVKQVASNIVEEIIEAKNMGMAIGLLSKMVKEKYDMTADGEDLKECVMTIRNNVNEFVR
jgi:uncharacterized protein YqeY